MRSLLAILLVGALSGGAVASQESERVHKSGAVRILTGRESPGRRLLGVSLSSFDVVLPLSEIPADATAAKVLKVAEQRTNVQAAVFIAHVSVYRWSTSENAYIWVKSSKIGERSVSLVRNLQDGDVLFFYSMIMD
jgi:hypothetical protein